MDYIKRFKSYKENRDTLFRNTDEAYSFIYWLKEQGYKPKSHIKIRDIKIGNNWFVIIFEKTSPYWRCLN